MAIGAVLLSLPTAVLCSLLLSIVNGLSTQQGFFLYAFAGFLSMAVIVVVDGLAPKKRS